MKNHHRPTVLPHNLLYLVSATQTGACLIAQCGEEWKDCSLCCCGDESAEGRIAFEEWKKSVLNGELV